jgi:hypothetical protein
MNVPKKRMLFVFAFFASIILVLAGIGLFLSDYLLDFMGPHSVSLQESSVVSGVPVKLHFSSTEEKYTVYFPENVMVAHDGIFRNVTEIELSGDSIVEVLIPPSVSAMSVGVQSEAVQGTFELTVEPGNEPLVSGESYYEHETTMGRRFNNRNVGTIQMRRASEYYSAFFSQLGYESEIREYEKQDGYRTYSVLDVVAYKWGTEHPDEWIILGGHYDIAQRTIEGAYDNTAGACAVVELAEGFAKLTTSRTLVFGLWDGEEKGLWGSNFFANDLPAHVDVKAYLNFDMVGLNWPLPYNLLVLIGPDENSDIIDCPDLNNIANDAVVKYLGYPTDGIDIRESSGGGSDHLSFQRKGVQSYFFIGDSPYIQYHRRTDLIADMVAYAGGQNNLERGFNTVVWVALYITLLIDNNETLHQLEVEE